MQQQRELAKVNYRIHTDAIKKMFIVTSVTAKQISYVYVNEADVLNVALFGKTAAEWRSENPDTKGSIRDFSADVLIMPIIQTISGALIE